MLHSRHSTLLIPHSRLYTQDSQDTLHLTPCTLPSTLYTPHSPLYTPHSPFYTPHFTLHSRHFPLHNPHLIPFMLHSPLNTPLSSLPSHSSLCTRPHMSQNSPRAGTGESCTRLLKYLFHKTALRLHSDLLGSLLFYWPCPISMSDYR